MPLDILGEILPFPGFPIPKQILWMTLALVDPSRQCSHTPEPSYQMPLVPRWLLNVGQSLLGPRCRMDAVVHEHPRQA